MTTYAVGDLHGRYDLLDAALTQHPTAHFVFLGDYIDRGPDSKRVLRKVLELAESGRAVLLWGNHEELAWQSIVCNSQGAWHCWQSNGGGDAYRSYSEELEALRSDLVRLVKVSKMPFYIHAGETGNVLLCHAVVPAPVVFTAEHDGRNDEHLWNRPNDPAHPLPSDCIVSVHGHTPMAEPTFDAINKRWFIDLGSFKYGRVGLLDLDTLEPSVVAV